MPDKPSRSAYVPVLIIIGVMLLIALGLLIPILECSKCDGIGAVIPYLPDPTEVYPYCEVCGGSGKVPLLNLWRRE